MRKKLSVLFIIAALAILAGLVLDFFRMREPAYEGKSLAAWLEEYYKLTRSQSGVIDPRRQAREARCKAAIQAIGTNAIPTLLKMARAHDSPMKRQLMALAEKQKFITIHLRHDTEYYEMAVRGFSVLGAKGKAAVPSLIELLNSQDSNTRLQAADCLGNIGPDAKAAVPVLLKSINDTNQIAQWDTLINLGRIHMEPELAVPALMSMLNSSNANLDMTIMALGKFGEKAKPAVPLLLRYLDKTNGSYRCWQAVTAIKQISPETLANLKQN